MLSFRKKILLSDAILFLVFIALLFPFVERTVGSLMRKSLQARATKLIVQLEKADDLQEMLEMMRDDKLTSFHQTALISPENRVLYDVHGANIEEQPITAEYEHLHPEIRDALKYGQGFSESYSPYFKESFAYEAVLFEAQGQQYIFRVGYPYAEIRELIIDFEMGFLFLGTFILLLYSMMTWAIIHRLSQPIQQIIDTIRPYQEGREELPPRIVLSQAIQSDEFGKLAFTLNSLSEKIQKQIENLMMQKKETEDILESLGEGVIALDTTAKVTFANQVGCKMLGVPHDEMMGQTLDVLHARSEGFAKKCHEMVLHALQTSETVVQTWTLNQGGRIYLDLIASPQAHQSGAILVIQDKTSDYKIIEMGKDFVANASHELRTPITIIRGFAETLQDHPKLSPVMLKEIIEKIVRTCGRLDKLVKSLLTLANIENIHFEEFSPTDLSTLIENCKHLLLTAHPQATLVVEKKCKETVILADSDLLELAFMNLFENAVRYSPPPAKIKVILELGAEKTIQIHIEDQGIGIPENDLSHIFDRFYTVDKARSRKSGGAGLGLSIVKTIVNKHKGKVVAASELGKGSTFTITLPLFEPM